VNSGSDDGKVKFQLGASWRPTDRKLSRARSYLRLRCVCTDVTSFPARVFHIHVQVAPETRVSSTRTSAAAAAAATAAAVAAVAYSVEDSKVQAAAPAVDFKEIENVGGASTSCSRCHDMIHVDSPRWSGLV